MKKTLLLVSLLISGLSALKAQTNLSSGDIAFLGIQSGESGQSLPDKFAFVLLKDIEEETKISFTDNSVLNPVQSAKYCSNEGFCDWTATSPLSAGTVVVIQADSTVSTGEVVGTINLSQSGDQIIAFQAQGNDSIPVAAISTTGFEANCVTSCSGASNNRTCLPVGLANGVNAISFPSEQNNAFFNLNDLSGSISEILAQINNPANWTRSDQYQSWDDDTWEFNITSVANGLEKETISIFPNPVESTLNILGASASFQFQILDVMGKIINVKSVSDQTINVEGLPSGFYSLKVIAPQGDSKSIRFSKK